MPGALEGKLWNPRPRYALLILQAWLESYSVSGEGYRWFENIFYFEKGDFIIQGKTKLQ